MKLYKIEILIYMIAIAILSVFVFHLAHEREIKFAEDCAKNSGYYDNTGNTMVCWSNKRGYR